MRSFFILAVALAFSNISLSQSMDSDQFKTDIIELYNAGMKSFKSFKEGESYAEENGNKLYKTTLTLNEAKTVFISEDSEHNYKFVAHYSMKNVRDPKVKLNEISALMLEATTEFGLEKNNRTDMKYVGYQKQVIEFPADNIDDMGKHTSFEIGLTDDGNPMSFEIVVTEILWK